MRPPTLYSFRRCPYAMRARMALASAGIVYQKIEVSLRAKPPELLAISPKGTVPVMQLPDGRVLDQSLDIMRWALCQNAPHNDPDGWLSAVDADEMNHWMTLCDETFKPLLDRYKYANQHPEWTLEEHRTNALSAFILPLEIALHAKKDKPYRASLADVAIFPFVRQFAAVDKIWFQARPLPALQAWLSHWLNSDLFATIMQR